MKRMLPIAAAILTLWGCGDSAFKRRVQDAVKFELTDPQSAQFSDDWYDEGRDIACGAVNARNQFGGYAGKRLWVWKDYGAHHQPDFGTPHFARFNEMWEDCQRARFPDQYPARPGNAANAGNAVDAAPAARGQNARDGALHVERDAERAIEDANRALEEAERAIRDARPGR